MFSFFRIFVYVAITIKFNQTNFQNDFRMISYGLDATNQLACFSFIVSEAT